MLIKDSKPKPKLDDNPETATVDSESSMAKMFRFSEEVTNRSQKGHDTKISTSNLANTA